MLSVILLVLVGFNIHMNIWYRKEIKYLDDVRKQYEDMIEAKNQNPPNYIL